MMTYTHDDYTVGWIAALSDELASAQASLDDEHDTLAAVQGDYNAYTLGRIGSHNVVIAGLPEGVVGTNAAGHAAANLFRSFPNIRFALMVGVGGGVPAAKIRLGDVVVSVPVGQTGGVIQYDIGTNLQEEGFIRKGFLRDPPSEVLTAIKKLRATARRKGYKLKTYYDTMLEENPLLRPDFERPKQDSLFEPDCVHVGVEGDCSKCDTSKLIEREDCDTPVVHYGLIGSGNHVIRNATLRDQLYEDEGIICLEMEAAGLMRNFECLVIRGICDYCDTHKNKHWQPYAGAVAAAYAKELLLAIPAQQVKDMPKSRVLESIQEDVKQVSEDIGRLVTHTQETHRSEEFQEAIQWLAASDPETNYRSALELRDSGSGSWLVECAAYVQWKLGSTRHIWLHGKAGCGKSVIAATIIEDIKSHCQNKSGIRKQSYRDCLCSLITQVANRDPASTMLLQAYRQSRKGTGSNLLQEESLEQILISEIQSCDQFFLILDALDESPETLEGNSQIRQILLRRLCALSSRAPKLKILSTSRHLNDIKDGMKALGAESMSMITNLINEDIIKYVRNQLSSDSRLSRLNSSMKKRVENVFMEKADGMFRWAYCQMRELKSLQSTKASHIERVLLDLPYTLDETYNRMIKRIQPELWNEALILLRWLTYSKRPMTLAELSEATIVDPYAGEGIVDFDDRGSPEDVLEILSGLIIITTSEKTNQDNPNHFENYMFLNAGRMNSDGDDTVFKEKTAQSKSREHQSVRLAHFSVQEYLESTRILASNIKIFYLQKTKGHQFLSDCCLKYLISCASSDKIMKSKKDLDIFPLLEYAAWFWYQHSQDADDISWQIRFLLSEIAVKFWTRFHRPDAGYMQPTWIFPPADINYQAGTGLYYAASVGLSSPVEALIKEYGIDVNAQGGRYGTALQCACATGHDQIVKTLIEEHKADVNTRVGQLGTALRIACELGYDRIVRLLLEKGADVNAHYNEGNDALRMACLHGHEGIVKLLIENGADVATQDGVSGEALRLAIHGRHEGIVKLLIETGAYIKTQKVFSNALSRALDSGHEGIIKIFKETQIDAH